jgi:hypothetical protein
MQPNRRTRRATITVERANKRRNNNEHCNKRGHTQANETGDCVYGTYPGRTCSSSGPVGGAKRVHKQIISEVTMESNIELQWK